VLHPPQPAFGIASPSVSAIGTALCTGLHAHGGLDLSSDGERGGRRIYGIFGEPHDGSNQLLAMGSTAKWCDMTVSPSIAVASRVSAKRVHSSRATRDGGFSGIRARDLGRETRCRHHFPSLVVFAEFFEWALIASHPDEGGKRGHGDLMTGIAVDRHHSWTVTSVPGCIEQTLR